MGVYSEKSDPQRFNPDTIRARKFRGLIRHIGHSYGFPPIKPNLYPKISVLDGKSMKN